MVNIRREFIQTKFGYIHVRISGNLSTQKRPLMCLHMAPQSGQDFEAFMKLADQDRLVIAVDYPGYGESDPLPSEVAVSIDVYAQAIWQVTDALSLSIVDILGYHTGSKVGIEMALQSPLRTGQLYCISLSTMTREAFDACDVKFEPLNKGNSDDWREKLRSYYDPDMPENILQQKYATSMKAGSRSHLGFVASHSYNAIILDKLGRLQTPMALINPFDDLHAITPKAADYINNCLVIERKEWLPGFLDVNPQSVLETLNFAARKLNQIYGTSTTSLVS